MQDQLILMADFTISLILTNCHLPNDSLLLNLYIAPISLVNTVMENLLMPSNFRRTDRFSYLVVKITLCCCGRLVMPLTAKKAAQKRLKWILNTNIPSCSLPWHLTTNVFSVAAETKKFCYTMLPRNPHFFIQLCMYSIYYFFFVDREKLLHLFQHPDQVNYITLQPRTNGNVFATVCGDSKFRLFDIRQRTTGKYILISI